MRCNSRHKNTAANGRSFAHKIANDLVKEGYITVSGLALGIDSSVHQAAISQTIEVIVGGVLIIYIHRKIKNYLKI
ncbi:DNA-processing protein DprA [Rickettsia argasii]|uniref:DNA recombination-mediator A family protein n=1 Tax=Rickettsia argasii T170-B TaxID=1268837 RepID=A0A0F3RH27_9RICK|nr:DNA-processing protein DprA [Rickettsia argasii]KJW05573.1 DNA recombination-mediator A family protein [Rickettsia argasii T170-B]